MKCPCCGGTPVGLSADALSTLNACRFVAEQAVSGGYAGGVMMMLRPDGSHGPLIDCGNSKRFPYSISEAAKRVQIKYAWKDPE